jgi:NTE family protein
VPLVSILTSRSIRSGLRELTESARFEELRTPLGIVAVDIETGEEVLFRSGVVWPAMVASMAFPGIYEPVRIGRHLLVDGGVLNPVPVSSCVALGADLVISSNLSAPNPDGHARPDANGRTRRRLIVENIARSLEIMQSKIVEQSCNHADVAIEPFFRSPPGLLDFKRGRDLEEAGEEAVERALPKLRATLPWLS